MNSFPVKKMLRLEVFGIFFVLIFTAAMQNVSPFMKNDLVKILFCPANDSIWELLKTMLLPYLLWGIIELMCVKPAFRRFVAAKTVSLYIFAAMYILTSLLLVLLGFQGEFMPAFVLSLSCIALACYISFRLYLCALPIEQIFAPCVVLLFLFVALYCSFTPFPPHIYIFMDRQTGLYGVIPEYFDTGAAVLDALYSF